MYGGVPVCGPSVEGAGDATSSPSLGALGANALGRRPAFPGHRVVIPPPFQDVPGTFRPESLVGNLSSKNHGSGAGDSQYSFIRGGCR